ncbi:SRPBCC family protein [Streptomyces halstedii]|uniref:SRPBCC family protein n=1 Tax=Streptomyces halstedii TaxID=1944 RepID=UPI00345FF5AB
MRYAERPSMHREIQVVAEPSRIWECVADVEAMAGWSPELARVEWRDGADGPAEGASYVGHNEHPTIGSWRTLAHVTACVADRTLTWCVLDVEGRYGPASEDPAQPMATWSFDITPAPGGAVLRQTVTLGPGPSGLTAYIARAPEREEEVIAYRFDELAKGMDLTLQGVKAAAEGAAA